MGKITSELLAKIAPSTNNSTRSRFLPFLNEACPRYGIVTENQVAAFLATCAFESAYFKATKEGRATRPGKAKSYQDKYWSTGYFGRGILQVTHRGGYQEFQNEVGNKMGIDVMAHPELLEQPRWAVESACNYWKKNRLNRYADQGLKGYFALQGSVNRGNPNKEALEYPTRLHVFETVLRYLPDGFTLDGSDSAVTATPTPPKPRSNTPPTANNPQETPPTPEDTATSPNVVPADVVPVAAINAEPNTVESVIGKWSARFAAIPAMVITFLTGIVAWIQNSPTNLIITIAIIGGVIAVAYISIRQIKEIVIKHRADNLQATREAQAFELQKITLESAARKDLNAVQIVQPPTVEIQNSDAPPGAA